MEAKLYEAIVLATKAHEGQLDKCGKPYIEHCLRVAVMADTIEKKIVAVLHDTVEDTAVTLSEIEAKFGSEIAEAIDAISHRKNEPRIEYYNRVMQNALSHSIKLLDIADNTSEDRLQALSESEQERLRLKYSKALEILA